MVLSPPGPLPTTSVSLLCKMGRRTAPPKGPPWAAGVDSEGLSTGSPGTEGPVLWALLQQRPHAASGLPGLWGPLMTPFPQGSHLHRRQGPRGLALGRGTGQERDPGLDGHWGIPKMALEMTSATPLRAKR